MKRLWPGEKPHKKILPMHLFRQGHWFYLCHALLLLLLLYPYLERSADTQFPWPLALMNSLIVVLLVWVVSFNRRQLVLISILGLISLASEWLPDTETTELIRVLARVLLYGYAILMMIPYLLIPGTGEEEDGDQLFAAVATYLLFGLIWTSLYAAVEWFYPGSFHVAAEYNLDGVLTWSDFLYFSFTTLTTLGYGEMVPVTSQARSLAILEAATGVLYIAIMIARTVGFYVVKALK